MEEQPRRLRTAKTLAQGSRDQSTNPGDNGERPLLPGIPTGGNVHEVAQQAHPGVRVAYVDNDPIVHVHATATPSWRFTATRVGDLEGIFELGLIVRSLSGGVTTGKLTLNLLVEQQRRPASGLVV